MKDKNKFRLGEYVLLRLDYAGAHKIIKISDDYGGSVLYDLDDGDEFIEYNVPEERIRKIPSRKEMIKRKIEQKEREQKEKSEQE